MPPARKPSSGDSSKPPTKPPAKVSADAGPPPGGPRVVLLVGPEAGRKNTEAQRLLQSAVDPDFADFDAETMDGNNLAADRVLSAVGTVPLGVGKRAALVRDTQQMEPEEQKRLAAGLARIPASGFLVLHTGTPVVEDGKTKRQSVVATELLNAVKKVGQVTEFALPKAEDVRPFLVSEARRQGKTLAPDALTLLSQLPGDDLNRVGSELEKAILHAGSSVTITGADVEATLSRSPDDVIFKLCDAVGARKTSEVLGYVSTLFRSGGRPDSVAPRVLVLLARQFRLIAQFRYLGEQRMAGRNAGPVTPEVLALLPSDGAGAMASNPRMSWMSDKYISQARHFTLAELTHRMERILAADLALKGIERAGEAPQAVLQRLVVELC